MCPDRPLSSSFLFLVFVSFRLSLFLFYITYFYVRRKSLEFAWVPFWADKPFFGVNAAGWS